MSEKSYSYGRSWVGIVFGLFLVTLFLYGLIRVGTKDRVIILTMGFMILMALAFGAIMFAALGTKITIGDGGITYQEPLAKNLKGQKKVITSRWEDILEVKGYRAYLLGQDVIVKTVNGTFRITSDIQGYRDLMGEIREHTPHLRQVPGSSLLYLVKGGKLAQVRKRKLPLKIKIWIGLISIMIIAAYVYVARSAYDFFMISLAWFYVGYLVQTRKR